MKKVDYSETIAACDLKLSNVMKVCEYWRSRSFLDLDPMSFIDDLSFVSQKKKYMEGSGSATIK